MGEGQSNAPLVEDRSRHPSLRTAGDLGTFAAHEIRTHGAGETGGGTTRGPRFMSRIGFEHGVDRDGRECFLQAIVDLRVAERTRLVGKGFRPGDGESKG